MHVNLKRRNKIEREKERKREREKERKREREKERKRERGDVYENNVRIFETRKIEI
jgi:hypothetical protein